MGNVSARPPDYNLEVPKDTRLPKYLVEAVVELHKKKHAVGGVGVEEFIAMFDRSTETPLHLRTFLGSLFRAYDHDGNRKMEFREMLEMLDVVLYGDQKEKISGIFRMCDNDGDGFITRRELQTFMLGVGWFLQEDQTRTQMDAEMRNFVDDIFMKFDTDKDGRLTHLEFQNGCRSYPGIIQIVQNIIDAFVENISFQ